MNKNVKIALLGGDVRQLSLARRLCEEYISVCMWGIDCAEGECGDARICTDLADALGGCDAVILPLPTSVDGTHVSCPLTPELPPLRLKDLLRGDHFGEKKPLILGGKLSPSFKDAAAEVGIRALDYFESEILQIRNALPTAEGALEIALHEMKRTVHSSKSAVVGYGRISKALSRMLLSMRSEVTVAARKQSDLAFAEIDGCKTLKISYEKDQSSLMRLCSGYDVIFNTVPYWVFDRKVIEGMDKSTVVIDLASAPGGFDTKALKDSKLKVIRAQALPGRCAPITAGQIIGETIIEILRAEGVSQ